MARAGKGKTRKERTTAPAPAGKRSTGKSKKANVSAGEKGPPRKKGRNARPLPAEEEIEEEGRMKGYFDEEATASYEYTLPQDFDDEDIDEDAAFDDNDEDMYGDLLKRSRKPGGDEDDEEEAEEDGEEEGLSLSDMMEKNLQAQEEAAKKAKGKEKNKSKKGKDEDEAEDEADDEDQTVSDKKHAAMMAFINDLDALESDAVPSEATQTHKPRPAAELTEAFDESEFGFAADEGHGLKMSDLMGNLGPGFELSKLKKKFSRLSKDKAAKQVSIPLEEVHADRLTRKEAYQETKTQIQKWAPMVAKMRDQSFTSFPLNEENHKHVEISSASLQSRFKPKNDLEADLESILTTYGYKEKHIRKKEESQLADRSLTKEEIQQRQQEIAKIKSLLFHHEIKMKRLKKIKSKAFRKIKKKREDRLKPTQEEMEELDPEQAAEDAEKSEVKRIRERMSQKHKGTSKWAKAQKRLLKQQGGNKNLTGSMETSKQMLEEQYRIGQTLAKKISAIEPSDKQGDDSSDEEDSDEMDEGDEEQDPDVRNVERLKQKLAELKEDPDSVKEQKGIFGLKFMQRSMAKRKAEADELQQELEDMAEDPFADHTAGADQKATSAKKNRNTQKDFWCRWLRACGCPGESDERISRRCRAGANAGQFVPIRQGGTVLRSRRWNGWIHRCEREKTIKNCQGP